MKIHNNFLITLGIGIVLGAVAIGLIMHDWGRDREPPLYSISSTSEAKATPPSGLLGYDPDALSRLAPPITSGTAALVTRVASRFVCSCGTCGEKRLDICSCDTALKERAFIQEQLDNGRSEKEAAEALNKKYGGLKS